MGWPIGGHGPHHKPNPLDDGVHIDLTSNTNIYMSSRRESAGFWETFGGVVAGGIFGIGQNLLQAFMFKGLFGRNNGGCYGSGTSVFGGGYSGYINRQYGGAWNNGGWNGGNASIFGSGYGKFNIDNTYMMPYNGPIKGSATDAKVGDDEQKDPNNGDNKKVTDNTGDKTGDGSGKKVIDDNDGQAKTKESVIKGLVDAIDGSDRGIITGENTEEVKNKDDVDNVQAGKAGKAKETDAKEKTDDGLYKFFTITDESGNEYTLGNPTYNDSSKTITYTIIQADSNLTKDDSGSDKGYEFNKDYEVGTQLTVEVKDGKIVVTNSSGKPIATKDAGRYKASS